MRPLILCKPKFDQRLAMVREVCPPPPPKLEPCPKCHSTRVSANESGKGKTSYACADCGQSWTEDSK